MKKAKIVTALSLAVLFLCSFGFFSARASPEFFYEIDSDPFYLYKDKSLSDGRELALNAQAGLRIERGLADYTIESHLSGLTPAFETSKLREKFAFVGKADWPLLDLKARWEQEHLSVSANRGWSYETDYGEFSFDASSEFKTDRDPLTTQKLGADWQLPTENVDLKFSTNWNFEDFSSIKSGSVQFSLKGDFELSQGQIINTSIQGKTFNDKDGSGTQDQGEEPVSSVEITLRREGKQIKKAVSNQGGAFSFGELKPGNYEVVVSTDSLPPDFEMTTERKTEVELKKGQIKKVKIGVRKPPVKEKTTYKGTLGDN